MPFRVGSGFDVHRLKRGRRFVLGCVELDWPAGPQGHSDGDPLAHALADALLGGAGLGDIGERFPDGDPGWRDCPGSEILGRAVEAVAAAGWRVANADLTVVLERPYLRERKAAIRQRLAAILGVEEARVGLKARTAEGFGAIGRGNCVAALACVLLERAGGGREDG